MKIFQKTLREEFLITLIFCILLSAGIYLVIQEFAVARQLDFSYLTERVPDPLKKIAEAFLVLNVFGGYLHIVASVAWIMIGSVYTCVIFSGLVARETEQKTLPLLIAHPVGRTQLLLEKYLAAVIYLFLINLAALAGFYLGTYHGLVNVPYQAYRFVYISINGAMFFLALSSLTLLLSVVFKEHKKAAITSLIFFLVSYLTFFLAAFSPKWAKIKAFTLFRFFDTEKLFMSTQFQWGNCTALLIITVILLLISGIIFHCKDLDSGT
jgi:ABC-2 type transport system permease protein